MTEAEAQSMGGGGAKGLLVKAFVIAGAVFVAIVVLVVAGRALTPRAEAPPTQPGIVWKAGDAQIGQWIPASSGQCGKPVVNGDTFTFALTMDGTNCIRNQANPIDPKTGNVLLLRQGATYQWTWHEFDGPAPGMGIDKDARSLVWQIHGYIQQDSPCTGLTFINGPDEVSTPQMWGFSVCGANPKPKLVWSGAYTPGESDDWKVVAKLSSGLDGWTELWRNGKLQGHWPGVNFHNSLTNQAFFNFGPYKWRWQLPAGGGSSMRTVNQTISGMTLEQLPN